MAVTKHGLGEEDGDVVEFGYLARLERVALVVVGQDEQADEGDQRGEKEDGENGPVEDALGLFDRRQGHVSGRG